MAAGGPVPKGEVEFALRALQNEGVRVDGRGLTASRRCGLKFGAEHGEVEVTFGATRALAVCSGEIVPPAPERPNEGRLSFHVDFGPMASPIFDLGRPSPQATSVANFVERLLRGSRAVDAEALCIVGGQKVWSIRVDIRALDDDGNLADVSAIAALCAVMHFRKADVDVSGESARVYSTEERVPVPLSIHHLPVPVTFALFRGAGKGADAETMWILDPSRVEEAAMAGAMCIAANQHGEICGVHKPGGLPVDIALIQHCTAMAQTRARELIETLRAELDADLARRAQGRKNVHRQFAEAQLLTVDWAATPAAGSSAPEPQAAQRLAALAPAAKEESVSVVASPRKPQRRRPGAAAAASAAEASGVAASSPPLSASAAAVAAQLAPGCDLAAELRAVAAEKAELERKLLAAEAGGAPVEPCAPGAGVSPAAGASPRKKKRRKSVSTGAAAAA
ncbi:unnamed protein product [Prorocentrum cordatum]|uniref:Exosome complex component RRP45 n=1 Tax=Prorocentrum cordatum TaxID=2364126 RepID=A0ABN9WXL8_9DINO|nr:unnamed protein product [Polarella glacialis]